MPEPACKGNRPGDAHFRAASIEVFPPGEWRNWCDDCEHRAEELGFDDPAEVSDVVLRRTGNGSSSSGGPKTLHLPLEAVEEVPAQP